MHHKLDVKPIPENESPLFINEPWLTDDTYWDYEKKPESDPDHIRVYIPLDISKESILRRLRSVIARYGEANENNELRFSVDVGLLIHYIEIYDQIWLVRDNDYIADETGMLGGHSRKAKELVREFIHILEKIPDGCAECFPFEEIAELTNEYLSE